MLEKPSIKNKEGVKTLGVYGLILLVVGKNFMPELTDKDILDLVAWWNSHNMSFDSLYDYLIDGTAGAYILNKLRTGAGDKTL